MPLHEHDPKGFQHPVLGAGFDTFRNQLDPKFGTNTDAMADQTLPARVLIDPSYQHHVDLDDVRLKLRQEIEIE